VTPLDERCLAEFGEWLAGMPGEVVALSDLLEQRNLPEPLRLFAARALGYLRRSIALIPEGIEDLGCLDVLFATRVRAARLVQELPDLSLRDESGTLARLTADAELVQEFLGEDFERSREAWLTPMAREPDGFEVDEALESESYRAELLDKVRTWAEGYVAPVLELGENELVKLRAFLRTKLPRQAS
jgi:hypothetical protein